MGAKENKKARQARAKRVQAEVKAEQQPTAANRRAADTARANENVAKSQQGLIARLFS
jgi:hypothetical protein